MTDTKYPSPDPPAYSELPIPSQVHTQPSQAYFHPSQTRTNHLIQTIDTYINPILRRRKLYSPNNTTIALLLNITPPFPSPFQPFSFPSSSTIIASTNDFTFPHQPPQIIALASEDNYDVKLQLTHALDTIAFWSQRDVRDEFCALLRRKTEELMRAGRDVKEDQGLDVEDSTDGCRGGEARLGSGLELSGDNATFLPRGFFRSTRNAALLRFRTGMKTAEGLDVLGLSSTIDMQVTVTVDELCFRTVSSFGLYETVTKPAVVVCVRRSG